MSKVNVYNLIILDESGSMNAVKVPVISGFNELVQTIKAGAIAYPEQQHYVTFITFNSTNIKMHLDREPVQNLHAISEKNYHPDCSTPLFDAVGFALTHLRKNLKEDEENNVLVTILTDGLENASREFTAEAINELIKELSEGNWTFTYIGADHDIEKMASTVGISNRQYFQKTPAGLNRFFLNEAEARMRYYDKLHGKQDVKKGYFNKPSGD